MVTKGGDLDNFKKLLSREKSVEELEEGDKKESEKERLASDVEKLLQVMKSRQADGEPILGMVWDDYKAECEELYPGYAVDGSNNTYSDTSLDNLYSLCKELYSEGKEAIAKGLIKLLSEVIQKNVVAVKEPLPL